jgi:hypothetical protein
MDTLSPSIWRYFEGEMILPASELDCFPTPANRLAKFF